MASAEVIAELRRELSSPQPSTDAFSTLKRIAGVVGEDPAAAVASELVLRALEQRERFAQLQEVLSALARQVGHFPYIEPSDLGGRDLLAYEFHRPLSLDEVTVFHRAQGEVYRYLLDGDNVILSAPTSFGKSKIIDAMIATGQFSNVAVVVPTLALIDETRKRLSVFRNSYKIITHPSQPAAARNLFVLTAERVLAYEKMPRIDFFVIDEFYKLGNYDDGGRMVALNSAFYRLRKGGGQFYLLGPNIDRLPVDADGQLNARFIATNFVTVLSEQHRLPTEGPDIDQLVVLCKGLEDPTIIYCASPASVNTVARALVDGGVTPDVPELAPMADWAAQAFHPEWVLCQALVHGVGIHHGRLPRSIAQYVVQLFNEGKLRFLVCTSTLIEGVNTKAKNVVIYDNRIAQRELDFFTFNNISGRSGRMFEHFIGHVFLFSDPPQRRLPYVDLPFLTQGEQSPTSLLVQIDEGDLTSRSKDRLATLLGRRELPVAILRANPGVSPEGQLSLAAELRSLGAQEARALAWTASPRYPELLFACKLIWKHLVSEARLHGVFSGEQLTLLTWKLQQDNALARRIRENLVGKYKAKTVDEAVERVLQFDRDWAGFELPRLLMALSRIQEYVFTERGLAIGNYSSYCTRLEALFRAPVIGALDEYGVPPSLGEKLLSRLGTRDDLDEALVRLRRLDPATLRLSPFENRLLRWVQRSL